jgi:phytanoyl-CoA hydroxylase
MTLNLSDYKERGFILAKGFFTQGEIDRIREQAREVFAIQIARLGIADAAPLDDAAFERAMVTLFEEHLDVFVNCGKQVQHLISLHKLSLDDRVLNALSELGLAFPNVSTRPVLYFNSPLLAKKEVYWRLSPHQDWRSMQGSLDAVVVWVPLIDIGRPLGALEVIPGSHKWGLMAAEMLDGYGNMTTPPEQSQFVPIEVQKGDALFFSALLVHQSGTNSTTSIRWSCHFRYNNLRDASFAGRGFPHPYLYKPQEELITPDFPEAADIAKVFP